MLSPKTYLKLVIGALVLPSYLGFESAAASVQSKLPSQEIAPVVQQANLKPGSSSQIAEYEEVDIDKLKGGRRCYRPRKVNYYRVSNPCNRYERVRERYGDYEEYGHGRRDRYRDDDDHDSHKYDHEDYEHETIHFGRHQHRHGRRHCI